MSTKVFIEAVWQGAGITKGAQEAEGQIAGLGRTIGAVAKGFLVFDVARRSLNLLTDSISGSWRAALDNEVAVGELDFTLKRFNKTTADSATLIERLRRNSLFDDEQIMGGLNSLVQGTQDYAGSLANLGLVVDIAAARHMDLGSASDVVAKAMAGNVRQLGMLFPSIRAYVDSLEEIKDPAERGRLALAKLNEQIGGRALEETKTAKGSIHELKEEFGELGEQIMKSTGLLEFFTIEAKKLTAALREGDLAGGPGGRSMLDRLTGSNIGSGTVAGISFVDPRIAQWQAAVNASTGPVAPPPASPAAPGEPRGWLPQNEMRRPFYQFGPDPYWLTRVGARRNDANEGPIQDWLTQMRERPGKRGLVEQEDIETLGEKIRGTVTSAVTGGLRAAFKGADEFVDYFGNLFMDMLTKVLGGGIGSVLTGGGFIDGIKGVLGLGGGSNSTASRAASANLSIRNARLA